MTDLLFVRCYRYYDRNRHRLCDKVACADFNLLLRLDKIVKAFPITNGKPGLCVIFNHEKFDTKDEDRVGTRQDVYAIKRTFRSLGFIINDHHVFNDLSQKDLFAQVKRIAENTALLSAVDCFVCFILTHGSPGNILMARDKSYKFDEILENFTATNCPALEGKPKIFILQVSNEILSFSSKLFLSY